MKRVYSIVAGGESVRGVNLSRLPGTVIGVNDAFCHAPCDIAFSMDRLWTENRWAALNHEAKKFIVRDAALKGIEERPPWLEIFSANIDCFKPSFDPNHLNGNNSGLCCLQWVYATLRALDYDEQPEVYMFGYDMTGQYWYPHYSWSGPVKQGKLRNWSNEFGPLARAFIDLGVAVFNCSAISNIYNFARLRPEEAYEKCVT